MNKKAFTLIELLVVVLIIGVLSSIALPQYQKAVERSRATEALTMLRAWLNAQKLYYLANGAYTQSFEQLDVSPVGSSGQIFNSAYFTYKMHVDPAAANFHMDALRKTNEYEFDGWLTNDYKYDQVLCNPKGTEKGTLICKTFGDKDPNSGFYFIR